MESIPEIRENDLGITISRRYAGGFEVSISYAGNYIRRYPLLQVTDLFLSCILKNVPVLGLWLFSKQKRKEMVTRAYSAAIEDFLKVIKIDVADAIFGEKQGE
jgi:hypothetical protein